MVWEIAQIDVKPGDEAAFEAAVEEAVPLFKARALQKYGSCSAVSSSRAAIAWSSNGKPLETIPWIFGGRRISTVGAARGGYFAPAGRRAFPPRPQWFLIG